MISTGDLLARIRSENLGVYSASPNRLLEDVAQEAEIAHDYRGRLVYELLQNADDAMLAASGDNDLIAFRLTDTDLWVGNSGRPLSDGDVEGLCGTGISTKGATGPKRASIGHKGMGFKSVLEVTDRPAALSTHHSFRMSARDARAPVGDVMRARGLPPPAAVPAMRFPWEIESKPSEWTAFRSQGIQTLFRFPLRDDLTEEQRETLATRLLELPVTALVFLKHLEHVEIEVERGGGREHRSLRLRREHREGGSWIACTGLSGRGTYRVHVQVNDVEDYAFLLAHDDETRIGDHRTGLDPYAWRGIQVAEVSIATPWPHDGTQPPGDWRRFHVFLPTGEHLQQPMLVNGAFATDLSRQEVRVGPESSDYNRFLAGQAAWVARDVLAPVVLADAGPEVLLALLERSPGAETSGVAEVFSAALREAFASLAFVPAEDGSLLTVEDLAVPPTWLPPGQGLAFRAVIAPNGHVRGGVLPSGAFCEPGLARVLVDLGASELGPAEAVTTLAAADTTRSRVRPHDVHPVSVDPVLDVIEHLWRSAGDPSRVLIAAAARSEPVFPARVDPDGAVERVSTDGLVAFYPPRSFAGGVPLERLCFIAPELSWGELRATERKEALRQQMLAWQGLFDIGEFKFTDVMRASVLPALDLEQAEATAAWRRRLQVTDRLAAICQLAGRTPKADRPLPYQRLGSDSALFNLARLPVPVRPGPDGQRRWLPAFRVYFGRDWAGDQSVEALLEAMAAADPTAATPQVSFLAPPETLKGLLGGIAASMRHPTRRKMMK